MFYVTVLYRQQRVLHPLEYWLGLLHSRNMDLPIQKSNFAYGADHHGCTRAEHFQ